LSIDPVVTNANTGSSFNRYAYANNSPYKYIDPDGRNGVITKLGAPFVLGAAIDVGVQMYGPEQKTASQVDWNSAALSGGTAVLTGAVGGRAATAALQGQISVKAAVLLTAGTGGAAGAISSLALNAIDGKPADLPAAGLAFLGASLGGAFGTKLSTMEASLIAKLHQARGVLSTVGTTTASSVNFGASSSVATATTTGLELTKTAGDVATGVGQKAAEKELNK
jgi:hypothetical protein